MDASDLKRQDSAAVRDVFTLSELKECEESRLQHSRIGGKARGLVRLMQLGLQVPPGFVLTRASAPALRSFYEALGAGAVAVRSSMEGEDGSTCSFAGQFETSLHVVGIAAVRAAVARCFSSVRSARSAAYRSRHAASELQAADTAAAVIVQKMVPASKAGVLFTVDPVTQFRDRMILEVVPGFADRLVAGVQRATTLHLSRTGEVVRYGGEGMQALLTASEIEALVAGALHAEAAQGVPLDLEWAIDAQGVVHWLQMRPITTLDCDPSEFDTAEVRVDAVLTRGNVGEILPDAITPLTISTVVPAIENAMQRAFLRARLARSTASEHRVFKLRLGHLFIDLTETVQLARVIVGAKEENFVVPFCGRRVPEMPSVSRASWPKRLCASIQFFMSLLTVRSRLAGFERSLARDRAPALLSDEIEQWQELVRAQPLLDEAFDIHLVASLGAGAMHGVLGEWLAWCGFSQDAVDRTLAGLLRGIPEVDELSAALDAVFAALRAEPQAEGNFFRADTQQARDWLQSEEAGHAFVSFQEFLKCYGHRGEKEFELRAASWRLDSTVLIAALQARFFAPRQEGRRTAQKANFPSEIRGSMRFAWLAPFLLRLARAAVRNREKTKSLSVQVLERFKLAYRHLSDSLVQRGALAQQEDIFFLTHEEIGRLVAKTGSAPTACVPARRRAFALEQRLEFADISIGKPQVLVSQPTTASEAGDVLCGQPVSRGCATGRARVVSSLADLAQPCAENMRFRAEEILIVPAIDVGWTPYFGSIAGIATELGSAVSHGAVLAREYGLPAVVNLRNAMQTFRTGDWVTLDAERGVLRRATVEEQNAKT